MGTDARAPTTVIEAAVVTASGETVYRRAGHGRPVLLLHAPVGVFDRLAASPPSRGVAEGLLVVEPLRVDSSSRLPGRPGTDRWRRWLEELVDGLGLDRPTLVAGGLAAGPARAVAAADPDRFGPVVDAVPEALARAELLADSREH